MPVCLPARRPVCLQILFIVISAACLLPSLYLPVYLVIYTPAYLPIYLATYPSAPVVVRHKQRSNNADIKTKKPFRRD